MADKRNRDENHQEDEDEDLYVPLKKRTKQPIYTRRKQVEEPKETEPEAPRLGPLSKVRLIDQVADLKKEAEKNQETPEERALKEEKQLLIALEHRKKLMSDFELAKGIEFTEPMETNWQPPHHIRKLTESQCQSIRKKWHIEVDGDNLVPPIKSFKDMRFPKPIIDHLKAKGIHKPTPIQVQGIPSVLAGRDLLGIAFTGSGKTLVFCLPLIMAALHAETQLPLVQNEGPIGLVVVPSRELARQIYDVCQEFATVLAKSGYPALRILLCIGGINMGEQGNLFNKGLHIVCSTPGRLKQMLQSKKFNLISCKMLVLDEADRMVDTSFEDDVREIMSYFTHQRQTLLFSATMPKKIQNFAKSSLVQPIVVNVGRAGAANLDVVQEIEYVKEEAKIVYLLECLQKTPPPVLIFAENKKNVDDIHEYLLLKGVEAVAIHADKDQEEREFAIKAFKTGKKDVLVATDVASKGLDFNKIEHVINFDMPKEVEDYVHRIGRTGRGGKTGVATTFVNKNCSEQILLDLKHLLKEAKQKVPPFLAALEEYPENMAATSDERGCAFCGGLGHRIAQCPKLEASKAKEIGQIRSAGAGGRIGGGEY